MLRRGYSDLDYTGLPQMDFQKKRYSMAILEINLFQPLKKTAYIKKDISIEFDPYRSFVLD